MTEKFNAICIRSVSWRESDKLISLFTLEKGKVDCVVRGAMSAKSKWRFAVEPFCFAEYVLTEKLGKLSLTEANQIDGFYGIRYDIDRLYCASAVIEFVRQNVYENMKAYDLFLLTVNALKSIEEGAYPHLALVKYLIEAMDAIGYGASFSSCGRCKKPIGNRAFFDFDAATPLCENCAHGTASEMRSETLGLLSEVANAPQELFKSPDKNDYPSVFSDEKSTYFALKFLAYYMEIKSGLTFKSLSDVLGGFNVVQ